VSLDLFSHSCVWPHRCAQKKTLNCNRGLCLLRGWRPWLLRIRTEAHRPFILLLIYCYWEIMLWLGGCLGFAPTVVYQRAQDARVLRHFAEAAVPEGECGPCPVFALYPGIRLTTEEKSRKNLSKGSRKVRSRTVPGTIRSAKLSNEGIPHSIELLSRTS
jgi:hypothetical protein